MSKKSPKRQPQPATGPTTDPTPTPTRSRVPPPSVKKVETLPPDAVKRRDKFYEDSHEIEQGIWRSIYG
jgi:hypothetical protein